MQATNIHIFASIKIFSQSFKKTKHWNVRHSTLQHTIFKQSTLTYHETLIKKAPLLPISPSDNPNLPALAVPESGIPFPTLPIPARTFPIILVQGALLRKSNSVKVCERDTIHQANAELEECASFFRQVLFCRKIRRQKLHIYSNEIKFNTYLYIWIKSVWEIFKSLNFRTIEFWNVRIFSYNFITCHFVAW